MLRPSAVLFDLFATLAVEDFSGLVRLECELLDVSVAAFDAANRLTRPARSACPDGLTSTRMLLDALGTDQRRAFELFDLQCSWLRSNGRLYDDAVPTLHALRKLGVSTAVICNGSGFVRPWLDSSELIEAADVVIVSAEESVAKPDAAIFRLAATRLGVECGATCWFVDDQPDYLAGAAALSLRCFRIARPDTPTIHDESFEIISNLAPIVGEVDSLKSNPFRTGLESARRTPKSAPTWADLG